MTTDTTAPSDRLTCCVCEADLGDASDPYADPDCMDCLHRSIQADLHEDDLADIQAEASAYYKSRGL